MSKSTVKTSGTTAADMNRVVNETSQVESFTLEPNIYLHSDEAKVTVMFYAGSYTRYSSALFEEISDLFVNNRPKST